MKILMVSSWPPMACGIGKYAEQQVASLRREGHVVDVLSPPAGDGDFQTVLLGGLRPLRLLKVFWAYDRLWVHYTRHFYFADRGGLDRLLTSLAFLIVMLLGGRRFTFIVHESDYPLAGGRSAGRRRPGGRRRWLDKWWWRLVGRVVFHTESERRAFCAHYGFPPGRKAFEIWEHERYFERRCALDRPAARRRLDVEPGTVLLVCIGFIQPHKGFDRVIEALAAVPEARNLRLKIVGSVRIDWDQAHAYARRLHEMAGRDPRVEVIETWVSDELFDAWLVAADYVVLPYRQIWTSGIAARARLYDRPLIAADTGALGEQLTPGSVLFRDDDQLVQTLRRLAESNPVRSP
jgi:glycosyltransferase involved in cell wall biosynthesis